MGDDTVSGYRYQNIISWNMFVETVQIKCKLNREVLTRYKTRQFHLQGWQGNL
jgi:hypothetical protein